jgi:hypothetical protein
VMNISEELDMQVGCEIFPPKNSTVRPWLLLSWD